jgi:membrane protein DedA with SNARE-associated domain
MRKKQFFIAHIPTLRLDNKHSVFGNVGGGTGVLAPIASRDPRRPNNLGIRLLRILSLLVVAGITVYIYSIGNGVDRYAVYGYPGIFLIALLANATLLLPAPGVAIVYAMGCVFNPLGVALAAGTGGALGELSGYLAGFSGQSVMERTKLYERLHPWIQKYGAWAIFLLAAIPNPFFDTAGILAGMMKMPVGRFLLSCCCGQIIKMGIFAYAGYYSVVWLLN